MPEPRPFVDPVPTRPISLKKQRRAATRYRGQIRWREMSQLAARLWATAKSNTSKADALARTSPGSKEAVLLKRKAHAHLREAVALLGQVLHERKDFYLARLRLSAKRASPCSNVRKNRSSSPLMARAICSRCAPSSR